MFRTRVGPKPRTPSNQILGARVKARRRALGLTRERMAIDVGISFATTRTLEYGQGIHSTVLPALAHFLGDVSLDYLFGLSEDPGARATTPA